MLVDPPDGSPREPRQKRRTRRGHWRICFVGSSNAIFLHLIKRRAYRSKTPTCKKAQNLREIASAPGCSCSAARTKNSKCFLLILGAHSFSGKMTALGQFQKAKLHSEKIS